MKQEKSTKIFLNSGRSNLVRSQRISDSKMEVDTVILFKTPFYLYKRKVLSLEFSNPC